MYSNRSLPSGAGPKSAGGAIAGVALAFGVVWVASWAGLVDQNEGGSGDALSSLTTVGSTAPVSSTGPADSVVVVDTTPVTTTVASTSVASNVPTADNKAFLYIAGDSDAQNLGPPLQRALETTGVIESELHYKAATGLTRPDFYDWPAALLADVQQYNPDIVVVTFGGNDAQDFPSGPGIGTEAWAQEYGRRVGEVMDFLSADGRTLIWVGIPSAESGDFRARQLAVRDTQASEAAKRTQVIYVDAWNRFSGLSTDYADFIADPRDCQFKLVRQDDGFHLNTDGAAILALDVEGVVRDELIRRGATIDQLPDQPC